MLLIIKHTTQENTNTQLLIYLSNKKALEIVGANAAHRTGVEN